MSQVGTVTTTIAGADALGESLREFPAAGAEAARGRTVAHLALEEMIDELHRRAAAHQLDRGLRLSVAYFDDRRMALRWRTFTVIPQGRILFVPAFVVVAVEREIERVQADRQYTPSTRDHLIALLNELLTAFGQDPYADQA